MSNADESDMKIIEMLEDDGRISFSDLARKLGMKESTVRKRVLALQNKGIIKKFSVDVEPARIGLKTVALVGIDADPPKLLEVAQRLCELQEIRYVATSTGDHMIMTEIWTKDGRELTEILSKHVGSIEGIRKVCPAIILERFKG